MSYEGYEQFLCADGHYWTTDALFWGEEKPPCPSCKKPAVLCNSVDQTNGPDVGRMLFEEVAPAKTCTCKCGNVHETESARLKPKIDPKTHKPIRVNDEDLMNWCGRCGNEVSADERCVDVTCPFNDHQQSCPNGWVGHPSFPTEQTKCTCFEVEHV